MSVLGISAGGRARRPMLAGAVLAIGLVLAGCGTPLGVGAQVGDSSVSESTILDTSAQVVAENPGDTTADEIVTTRAVTTTAVNHQLVQAAAAASGVSADEAQVAATLAQISGNEAQLAAAFNIPLSGVETLIRDLLTQQAILKASPGGVPVTDVSVTFDVVAATDRDDAVAKRLTYLSDPARLTADATGAEGNGGANQQLTLLGAPGLGGTGLFSAPADSVVIFPLQQQWYVARINQRSTSPATLTLENQPQEPEQQLAFFNLVLQSFGQQTDVTVNPRFGVWDPLVMAVVPGASGV